jgi:lysozyme family protein
MQNNFETCVTFVLDQEGGYTNIPGDPGGPTNFGITLFTLRDWRKRDVTAQDVMDMKIEEAKAIYRVKFWGLCSCDSLPAGVDLMVFDSAVNTGPAHGIKWMQAAINVFADGVIGPKTLAAVAACDKKSAILKMADFRNKYYRALHEFSLFGKGWLRRVDRCKGLAAKMIG